MAAGDREALDSRAAEVASTEVAVGTADAAHPGQVSAIADLAVSRFGRIDTWAHVAGDRDSADLPRTPPAALALVGRQRRPG